MAHSFNEYIEDVNKNYNNHVILDIIDKINDNNIEYVFNRVRYLKVENNNVYINGVLEIELKEEEIKNIMIDIKIAGVVEKVEINDESTIDFSNSKIETLKSENIDCEDINGVKSIHCNTISCGDIKSDTINSKNISASDIVASNDISSENISCGDVKAKQVKLYQNLECADISGNVTAGGDVYCSDINGNVSSKTIDCGDIGGNVNATDVSCSDVGGNIKANHVEQHI
jgi:hypothetical protein